MATTTSRLKDITPLIDPSYWSEGSPDDFTATFELHTAKTDRPAVPMGRPTRTDHYKEQMYWNLQIFREVTYRESSTVNSIFEDPAYWATVRPVDSRDSFSTGSSNAS